MAIDVADALAVARTLNAHDVVVDYRPEVGIRVAPHVYNTVEEVDRAVDAMADIVRTRKYVLVPALPPVVT